MVDFSLLQTPDFFGNGINALQAGQQAKQQRERRNALAMYGSDPAGSVNALLAIGDVETASQRQGIEANEQSMQRATAQEGRAVAAEGRAVAGEGRTAAEADHRQKLWQLEETERRTGKALRIAQSIRSVTDPAQRMALFQQQAIPALREMGVGDDEINSVTADGLTDQEVDAFIVQAGGILEQAQQEKGVVVGAGSHLVDPKTGRAMFSAPSEPTYVSTSPGETNTLVSGGGAGQPVTTESLTALIGEIAPGARISSGGRSGADNTRVGGVPNSYHLPDSNGVSHAVDVVPSQGETTAQLAARLRQDRRAQGLDIIDEGDHVHLEPASGRGGPPAVIHGAARELTPGQAQTQARSDRSYASTLRNDYQGEPSVKDYADVDAAYRQTRALATKANPTPQDDTALTYSYLKMLDPGSVVREGEFAMIARSAGVPDRFIIAMRQLDQGKGLTPKIRADIVSAANTVYQQRRRSYDETTAQYRRMAEEGGVDPNQIIQYGGRSSAADQSAPPSPAAPKAAHAMTDAELKAALGL